MVHKSLAILMYDWVVELEMVFLPLQRVTKNNKILWDKINNEFKVYRE